MLEIDGNICLSVLMYSTLHPSVHTWIATCFLCNAYSLLSLSERQTLSYESNDYVLLFHIVHHQRKRVTFITIKKLQKLVTTSLRRGVREEALLYSFIQNRSIDSVHLLLFTCEVRCGSLLQKVLRRQRISDFWHQAAVGTKFTL